MDTTEVAGRAMHDADAERRREAARAMGSARTERKIAAARAVAESRRGAKWSEEQKAKLREAQKARRERERQERLAAGETEETPAKGRAGRPSLPLTQIPCTCGRDRDEQHPTTCRRGRAIRERQKKGQPLVWD